MLIFTRKINQRFFIDENIIITILDVNKSQVKIGIDAPRDIPVHRDEIHQRILAEREEKDANK